MKTSLCQMKSHDPTQAKNETRMSDRAGFLISVQSSIIFGFAAYSRNWTSARWSFTCFSSPMSCSACEIGSEQNQGYW